MSHVRFDKISHSGGGRGRSGRPDEPFLFSTSLLIHGPDSDLFNRHGLCIGVGAQEGPVKTQGAKREAQGERGRAKGQERGAGGVGQRG